MDGLTEGRIVHYVLPDGPPGASPRRSGREGKQKAKR